jgi:hypothetical protein
VAGVSDDFVQKIDLQVNTVWTRQFGSTLNEGVLGLAIHERGVIAVGGTAGTFTGQTNAGLFDAIIQEFDSDGTVRLIRQFGSSVGDQATGIFADGGGNVYLSGQSDGTLAGQTSAGALDAFVVKLSR